MIIFVNGLMFLIGKNFRILSEVVYRYWFIVMVLDLLMCDVCWIVELELLFRLRDE